MAVPAGTVQTYDRVGLRESLSDAIFNISPEDTPFLNGAGRGPRATATLEEWQTDTLAAPDGDNAHVQGDDATHTTPAATVRLGNYTQISRKTVSVSGTVEAVKKAGRKSEFALQTAKRGAEMKRDQETILLRNQGGVGGSAAVAGRLASILAFIKTNTNIGATGADPAYTSGVPGAARTDGTLRTFTEAHLKDVIQQVYTEGGNPRVLMVPPVLKPVVSGFSGIATRNFDISKVGPTAIIAAADVYVSDFGTLRVVPNRFMRTRDALVLDFDMVEVRYLRPHFTKALAVTGDSEKKMLLAEYTLIVKQEAGLGLIADVQA